MKAVQSVLILSVLALAASIIASAYDPSPLQDFCVATNDPNNALFVNGRFCKDPKLAKPEDFFRSGLNQPGNTGNRLGFNVTAANVDTVPGLNTLGIQLVRIDYAPNGQNPPHTHPRATEILVVTKGQLLVGFVTSNQADGSNKLFSKVLNEGDVFVFPIGLIHFQFNLGRSPAVAFAALNSQNPGVVTIANAVFGSTQPINPDFLARSFRLDKDTVERLQREF